MSALNLVAIGIGLFVWLVAAFFLRLMASEQLTDAALRGEAPSSRVGQVGWMGARATANLGTAALKNVGDQLSGRVPQYGTRMGQMSNVMDQKRKEMVKERNKRDR